MNYCYLKWGSKRRNRINFVSKQNLVKYECFFFSFFLLPLFISSMHLMLWNTTVQKANEEKQWKLKKRGTKDRKDTKWKITSKFLWKVQKKTEQLNWWSLAPTFPTFPSSSFFKFVLSPIFILLLLLLIPSS